eukprot:ANDGO_03297.mRNA.1 hypothetical protein
MVEGEISKVQEDIDAAAARITETENQTRIVEGKIDQTKAQYLGAQTEDDRKFWGQELNYLPEKENKLHDEKLLMLQREGTPLHLPLPEGWIRFCEALSFASRTAHGWAWSVCHWSSTRGSHGAEKRRSKGDWLCGVQYEFLRP